MLEVSHASATRRRGAGRSRRGQLNDDFETLARRPSSTVELTWQETPVSPITGQPPPMTLARDPTAVDAKGDWAIEEALRRGASR
jgi:hypothetical protein